MRPLAPCLTPLLLLGSLAAQEPGPAAVVAGVFEEARAEAQAFWRELCDVHESSGFLDQFEQLPSWPRYLARVEQAVAPHLAHDAIRIGRESSLASRAVSTALGSLRCEALPERQLVRIWDENEGSELWQEDYVRVSARADGGWAIASWPPTDLESLFSRRDLFPYRVRLDIVAEADSYRLESRGQRLADSRTPSESRWERFDRFLDDIVWPMSALDEQGDSREGALIRVPADAAADWLLQVLARLGRPGRRVPDVQLWITGADFPAYLYLDQRGAWGENSDVVPLRIPPDFKVSEALSAVEAVAAVEGNQDVAFILHWQGPEPDPALWLTRLDRVASPICSQFWMFASSAQDPGSGGAWHPDPDDPAYRRMWDRLADLLAPHRSARMPAIEPELAQQQLLPYTLLRNLPRNPLSPGEEWMVAAHVDHADGTVVRMVRRTYLTSVFGAETCWLQLQDGAWKFCSWPRNVQEQPLLLASASAYAPQQDAVHAALGEDQQRLFLTIGHGLPFEGESVEELASAFDAWLDPGFEQFVRQRPPAPPSDARDGSLILWASPTADQASVGLLVRMLARADSPLSQLRLQVTLDGTGRPGEVVFDQSVLHPGAAVGDSTGIRLQPGRTMQELCDDLDRQSFRGATRFHLLPPE